MLHKWNQEKSRLGSSEAEPLCSLQFLRGTVKLTHISLFLHKFGRNEPTQCPLCFRLNCLIQVSIVRITGELRGARLPREGPELPQKPLLRCLRGALKIIHRLGLD